MMPDQNGIYITKKQASVSAALLVILSLLLFIAGYFWGKQSVIDGFTQKTSQESFNDQVDYLLTMQSFAVKNGSVLPDASTNSLEPEQGVESLLTNLPDALEETEEAAKVVEPVIEPKTPIKKAADKIEKPVSKQSVSNKQRKHFAAIAGFAKKASAVQLVQRLKKHSIEVVIKTKTSKSSSGKVQKAWYQVVTPSYDSVQEVQALVDKILMFEKIKRSDIKIV